MSSRSIGLKETFYISHGSPTLSIDDSLPAREFLKSFKQKVFSEKPASILIISGHWETKVPTVNIVSVTNDTIYDFYGFPKSMYQLKYPAPGAPKLAKRVKELLTESGFGQVDEDKKRGLDHGAWVPLMLMYPEADIPVCQLSIQTDENATYHYNLGKALAPLKDEGVLVIGSGSATHNLRALRESKDGSVASWALEFDNWLKDALLQGRYEDVNEYEEKAPYAKVAHPWPDHFYPLHVAMGAATETAKAELIHHSWTSVLSYASYKYGDVNEYKEKAPHANKAHPWPDHFYPLHVAMGAAMGAAGENAKAELIHHSWSLHSLSYASYKFTSSSSS